MPIERERDAYQDGHVQPTLGAQDVDGKGSDDHLTLWKLSTA